MQKQRKSSLREACNTYNLSTSKSFKNVVTGQLFVEHTHKLIYCEVPKVGCTNWKKIIGRLVMNISRKAKTFEHNTVHTNPLIQNLQVYPREQQEAMLKSYTKVMFTRNPLERLVSAYRDKFCHSQVYFSRRIATRIKQMYRNKKKMTGKVSFGEFVQFLLDTHDEDVHWNQMVKLCDPCNIQYDFIGWYDTIEKDTNNILRFIGAPEDLRYPGFKEYDTEKRINLGLIDKLLRNLTMQQIAGLYELYKYDFLVLDY
uniref:Carbohydrate sulfotransferase n=2 Tax=Latimeria chalumnae TaxID=7897 RepID=H2ZVS3_LATCH